MPAPDTAGRPQAIDAARSEWRQGNQVWRGILLVPGHEHPLSPPACL